MRVSLISYTPEARELLILSKSTRLDMHSSLMPNIRDMSDEEKETQIKYVIGSTGSSLEFVDYVFLIEGVTRGFCMEKGTKVIAKKMKMNRGKKVECRGSKKIEEICIGDEVLSYNEKTGAKEWDKVIFTSKHMADDWYKISFDNSNELSMTEEHPVFVIDREGETEFKPKWIKAKDLKIGDEAIQTDYLGHHSRTHLKGKTLEQSYGKEIAEKMKASISLANSRSYKERYCDHADHEIKKRTQHFKGKSYEELLGKEKAAKMKEIRKLQGMTNCNLPEDSGKNLRDLWKNEREKMLATTVTAGIKSASQFFGKRSKPEEELEKIINCVCPGEFKYSGTGDLGAIGFRLPDFLNVNGKKKVIELFGCYWHSCPECGLNGPAKNDRKIYSDYKKLGYDCLVIWEHELKKEKELQNKIKTFIYNPAIKIIKIKKIERSSISRNSYNIETEKNHNFFAHGILVHNTHQFVRSRVGTSFAQQSLRVVEESDFDYLAENSCREDDTYHEAMAGIKEKYRELIKSGRNTQDARGILPTNILTNILFKANLRAMSTMASMRLCVRTQGEYQEVVKLMVKNIVGVHPWAEPILEVCCVQNGICPWKNFDKCPIKIKFGLYEDTYKKKDIKKYWQALGTVSNQPEVKK